MKKMLAIVVSASAAILFNVSVSPDLVMAEQLPSVNVVSNVMESTVNFAETTITAEQHGDMEKHARQNLRMGLGTNRQPTGFVAMPGKQMFMWM
ncbi:hypothetical protein [Paenibacillus sp. IHBB 10380]|uniref:hypothetical protein n=1 Tax=Paenibacillus sp. IHBB 10380 TaxID=1566358 RepID=UPI0006986700|nr:hypothetical protein [Paenibacillus sp. IHBB 10380]